jgi:hypothetical protein
MNDDAARREEAQGGVTERSRQIVHVHEALSAARKLAGEEDAARIERGGVEPPPVASERLP